jgi:hypothetical protein
MKLLLFCLLPFTIQASLAELDSEFKTKAFIEKLSKCNELEEQLGAILLPKCLSQAPRLIRVVSQLNDFEQRLQSHNEVIEHDYSGFKDRSAGAKLCALGCMGYAAYKLLDDPWGATLTVCSATVFLSFLNEYEKFADKQFVYEHGVFENLKNRIAVLKKSIELHYS